jgi:hypothetical protein
MQKILRVTWCIWNRCFYAEKDAGIIVNPEVTVFIAKMITVWGISHQPAPTVKMDPEATRAIW